MPPLNSELAVQAWPRSHCMYGNLSSETVVQAQPPSHCVNIDSNSSVAK